MREPTWSLRQTVPPAEPLLTVGRAKAHCRVGDDVTDDDALFEAYVVAAPEVLERMTERALSTQTWVRTADGFPCGREAIVLPRPPLQDVTSIQYRDPNGVLQTWDPSKYRVITSGHFGAIVPAAGERYPATSCDPDAVTVTFICGYATVDEVPARFMLAQQLLVAHWYAKRELDGGQGLGLEALVGAPARVDPCW